ncbi:MAG: hypothetical protein HYV09_24175 [Deltaproteobacteria bacterium]|nr:hypothetical protein [Deltaproteobacteria bacterium]
MIELLSPALKARAQAVKTKWDGFVPKIDARVQEVLAEADAGLDELIALHGNDPGPMGAAFSALQVRFRGLGQKLDEAWEKIDGELDQVRDDADSARDHEALGHLWAELRASYAQAKERIDLAYEGIYTRKNAAWGRALWSQAQRDSQQPVACVKCGAAIQQTVFHQSSNLTCAHCGAVNQLHPGMAAGLLFQGQGLHALAHEQAWNEWLAMHRAEQAYNGHRVPITRDRDALLAAARAYWTRYYVAFQQMHPGFAEAFGSVQQAVDARLAQHSAWDAPVEVQRRAQYQAVVDAAATGDRGAIQRAVAGADLDDAVRCVFEHGDARGTMILLELQHRAEQEDEPLVRWSGEQIARMSRDLRARA